MLQSFGGKQFFNLLPSSKCLIFCQIEKQNNNNKSSNKHMCILMSLCGYEEFHDFSDLWVVLNICCPVQREAYLVEVRKSQTFSPVPLFFIVLRSSERMLNAFFRTKHLIIMHSQCLRLSCISAFVSWLSKRVSMQRFSRAEINMLGQPYN